MSAANEKAPTRQRQGSGVNHSEEIHVGNTTAVQHGAQQLVRVFDGVIGGVPVQVVDGRELHTFLKNGKQFSDWIKQRIAQYGFEENQDFVSFSPKSEKPQVGRRSIEFHLTLDMAKELSMVENNEQGRTARRYFIQMERRALQGHSQPPRPEQFERVLCYFKGARIEFLLNDQRIWVKASNIATALRLGGSDRLIRGLPSDRKMYRLIGRQKHAYIDPEFAIRASDYCTDPELVSAWVGWCRATLRDLQRSPGAPVVEGAEALKPVERYTLTELLDARLLVTWSDDGRLLVKAVDPAAMIVTPDRLASVLEDPFAIDTPHLASILQAVSSRLCRAAIGRQGLN